MWSQDNDMAARKDAVMQNIRQELALANAQELMNVCQTLGYFGRVVH